MATEKSNGENNNPNNDVKSGLKNVISSFTGSGFTNGLAIILIFGSIAAIITLIIVHVTTVSSDKEVYLSILNKSISDKTNSQAVLDSFQNFYRETNASNANLLSILLPVIGAWIGAILAFYYGNKNLERVSDNFNTTIKSLQDSDDGEEKLKNIKVKDILDQFKDYKNVAKAKISEPVGQKVIDLGIISTLLLTDDNVKPLGFLSINDITNSCPLTKEDLKKKSESFKEFFTEMETNQTPIKDEITNTPWTEKGVQNYATILLEDSLEQAFNRMKAISSKQSVRGLVLDKGNIAGVITMDLFSKAMIDF